ncbi:hypothetical protein C0989_007197, partial [Termitomyces sp. Mn162]
MERKSSPEPGTGTMPAPPKRYRPAPAKSFQCRGYGDCRMVFSRSEHLARHIRKHTGERPFTCHCSKQFSRLDNLRQHAQTVHADKQEQNERMMRDLTSLHASMAAANKLSNARTPKRPEPPVKHEDPAPVSYELFPAWQPDVDTLQPFSSSRPTTSERLPPLSSIVSQQPYLRPRPSSSSAAYPKPFYYPHEPDPSPFYFAPPEQRSPSNPRKRALAGPDGPYDELAPYPQQDYDYGSESRPQSRRLSVMELCNNGELIDGFLASGERPAAFANASSPASASARSDEGRPGRISPPSRRVTPNANAYPPPRPHSTAFSVSSTSSADASPYPAHGHFAYPPPHSSHAQHQPPPHAQHSSHVQHQPPPHAQHSSHAQHQPPPHAQHSAHAQHQPPPHAQHPPYAPLHLVSAMSSMHYTSPAPTSASSYYPATSPRSASSPSSAFSPRSPGTHMAHQQAQAYHALQVQQQGAPAYPQG